MKAVLLDRDGTVIVEPPNERLTKGDDVKLFPQTIPALKLLQENGFSLIMITNQAGVGEGLISIDQFWEMEKNNVEALLEQAGVRFEKVFVCPHAADDGCDCRKPQPKLILEAAKEFDLSIANTYMIGDNLSDIGAGKNAGTKTILVKTGIHDVEAPDATYTAIDLMEAAQYIVAQA